MDPKEIREHLGLAEDASDDEVKEALARAKTAGETPPPAEPPAEGGEGGEEDGPEGDPDGDGDGAGGGVPQPEAAHASTVPIDRETLTQLQRDAADGAKARRTQVEAHRSTVLNAAVKDGKIPKSRKEHYAKLYAEDPEGTEKMLTATVEDGGLAAGLVPLEERGNDDTGDPTTVEAYPAGWLPEVAARAEGRNNGHNRVTTEVE